MRKVDVELIREKLEQTAFLPASQRACDFSFAGAFC